MNLISMDRVSKTLKESPLFENVSLGIESGDRLGLVGRNGCGKSTFLKMICGKLEPDSGSLARNRELSVSVLEQSPACLPGANLRQFLFEGDSPQVRLLREYHACLESAQVDERRLAELGHRMEEEGGFLLERRYISLLSELGLRDPEADLEELSGGMLKKAAIARCLAAGAKLVLMDEPTNHLDVETIEWLEIKLKGADFAFILVTHDRYFLEAVCGGILEIDRGTIFSYPGDYAYFLEKRRDRYAAYAQADARRLNILRDELEWLRRGPKARGGKSKSRKQRIGEMLQAAPEREESMESFSSGQARLGKKILEVEGLAKAFDGHPVIRDFSYTFSRGERIGIIGPNGSGKSTLLNLISGRLLADAGRLDCGENTRYAYFDQEGQGINRSLSVLEFMKEKADRVALSDGTSLSVEQFLERFLFPRPMFDHSLSRLSGGEFRRLQLIRLLASGCNFLLLDEPTNDFDIDTIALLEDFLISFPGCILAVSHDRAFLDRVTDGLFIFDGAGGVSGFKGDYSDYRQSLEDAAEEERAKKARKLEAGQGAGKNQSDGNEVAGSKKLSFKEKKELAGLLAEISTLEAEKAGLEEGFSSGFSEADKAKADAERYRLVSERIEEASLRWMELAEREE